MATLDTSRYPSGDASRSDMAKAMTEDQLREFLEELISSSRDLNVRVWLDGVYTDIDNTGLARDWMRGRELYFKVEGRVDGQTATKSIGKCQE